MGETQIEKESDPEQLRRFMQKVLRDARALEKMLEDGCFEQGVRRIGAEQELFLVDAAHRPAPVSLRVLEAIDDPHFTTELASFNLEINLDPIDLGPDSLSRLEADLEALLAKAYRGAASAGADIVMTGILPTLEKADLAIENMAPVPRYFALADAVYQQRGRDFEIHIKGLDELTVKHDSVMAEACNTSFQLHLQVEPASFARLYNIAQALAAPVLAAASNSPLFLGKRLWRETRIALFRQAVDTRSSASDSHHRHQQPRVTFGEHWIDDSVLEIFREDIARFRLLVSTQVDEDPFEALGRGEAPSLKALSLHNGTIYRWNRPCYGISGGRPHLRIENRSLPAGPTVIDEVANAALWFGALKALKDEYGDIREHIEFDIVKENFLAAARLGPRAQMQWLGDTSMAASEVVAKELVPRARSGLESLGIRDANRYLEVIEERMLSRRTGCQWMLDSLGSMDVAVPTAERLACLTAATVTRQKEGKPVHTWSRAQPRETEGWEKYYVKVGSMMTTDLFTVNENDVIDLAASLMDWRHIRHVPVEDSGRNLVGLVTHRGLLRVLAEAHGQPRRPISVREVMVKDVITVEPSTPTLEALALMKEHRVACLPVVENGHLVGMLSERDFMTIFRVVLENFLGR
ncbi:MAG: CBS domain-containing protein [bacterium]|nr:CBS domain-containing protein [bacterium]